jgi:hypothetical protein
MPNRSELVDEIIANTPGWRGDVLARLRELIHEADPDITEDAKWKRPTNPLGTPTYEHGGIVCTTGPLKERVRLAFAEGASLPDPHKVYNAMLEGNKTRAVDVRENDTLDEDGIRGLVRAAVELNLAKVAARAKK